jgi:hypothetical protein
VLVCLVGAKVGNPDVVSGHVLLVPHHWDPAEIVTWVILCVDICWLAGVIQVKPLRVALTSLSLCLGDSKKADWHQKGTLISQSRNVSKVDKAISKGDRHFHFFATGVVSERIKEGFGLSPLGLWAEGLVEVVVQGLHDGTEVFQVIPHLGMHFEVSRLLIFVTHRV